MQGRTRRPGNRLENLQIRRGDPAIAAADRAQQQERVEAAFRGGAVGRAGGFGLGGVLTPTGVGTVVEKGKKRIELEGKPYLLETALRADFALVQAFAADYIGNLYYALTARNFNPVIAMAADTVIVDAEHIVPVGVIAPDDVVTPSPVVDYIISHA